MEEGEESSGLEDMIKHHQQRPSYARMISCEFSKVDQIVCVKGNKKKRRKSQGPPSVDETAGIEDVDSKMSSDMASVNLGDDHDESSDEEFYSAEEELWDSSSCSPTDTEEEVFAVTYSANSEGAEGGTSAINSVQRGRAPSKKQKRKRKKQKMEGSFSDLPFANLELCDLDFFGEENEESIKVCKLVPSLQELCLQAVKRADKSLRTVIPYSMKIAMGQENYKRGMEKMELAKLYTLLDSVVRSSGCLNNRHYDYKANTYIVDKKLFVSSRSVWRIHNTRESSKNSCHISFQESKSGILPLTHAHNYRHISYSYLEPDFSSFLMSVMASITNILLPHSIHLTGKLKKRHLSGDQDIIETKVQRIMDQVKCVFDKRYPSITNAFFDNMAPYVFWARGDVKQATKSFLGLIEKENRARVKALYMYEIGRMHGMFHDHDKALDCLRETTEILNKKATYSKEAVCTLVEHQNALLKANMFDQGVMTEEKAYQASAAWTVCLQIKKDQTVQHLDQIFLLDSFLCYHLGSWNNCQRSWLEEAKNKVTMLVTDYPEMYYFESMLYAFEGKVMEAEKSYKMFLRRGGDIGSPGRRVKETKVNPTSVWEELAAAIQRQSIPPVPMRVLWRTQLSPPRMYDKGFSMQNGHKEFPIPLEADACSKALNLRLSIDGYITGDMQLLLPPIRGIKLHPFTGSLVITQVPGQTEVWKDPCAIESNQKDVYSYTPLYLIDSSFFPRLTTLYTDAFGNEVSLLYASNHALVSGCQRIEDIACVQMHWKATNGQRAKLNVIRKAREFIYQKMIEDIQDYKTEDSKKRRDLLKMCYERGYVLQKKSNYDPITLYLVQLKSHSKISKPAKTKSKPFFSKNPFLFTLLKSPVVFGKTIFLLMKFDDQVVTMYINCESRQRFLEPKLFINSWMSKSEVNYSLNWSKSDIFSISNFDCYYVFDTHGEEVDRVQKVMMEKGIPPVSIRSNFYYVAHSSRYLTCTCNGVENFTEMYGAIRAVQVMDEMLVLLTEVGLIFMEAASFMWIPVNCSTSSLSLAFNEGVLEFRDPFNYFKVIGEKEFQQTSQRKFLRAAITIDNQLVVVKAPVNTFGRDVDDLDPVIITSCLALSGQAQEVCFLSEHAGYLVTVSQYVTKESQMYRQNLYHYNHAGEILGVLANLGPGPRSFFPHYFTESAPEVQNESNVGWHVYMRDGHDGIICVKLGK